jgi:membrane protein
MVTIEKSFNAITRAPEGRPWLWRVTIYWTILTVSPIAIALMFWLDASIGQTMESVGGWQWLLKAANVLWSFAAVWLFMTLIYKLVPNKSVSIRSAMAGAFVAAVLLEIGKRTLGAYLSNAVPVSLLWGSLGLPIFMFWVYLMWLVVLFGLEVATILHQLRGRQLQEVEQKRPRTGLLEPAAVLTVMEVIARRFEESRPTTAGQIAIETSLNEAGVELMLDRLASAGFVHQLDDTDGAVVLARPPDRIPATELIEIGFAMVDEARGGGRSAILDRLREAQRSLMTSTTLANLYGGTSPRIAADQAGAPT